MPWAPCCLNRVHLRRGWPPPPTPPSSPPRPWGGRTYCPPAPSIFYTPLGPSASAQAWGAQGPSQPGPWAPPLPTAVAPPPTPAPLPFAPPPPPLPSGCPRPGSLVSPHSPLPSSALHCLDPARPSDIFSVHSWHLPSAGEGVELGSVGLERGGACTFPQSLPHPPPPEGGAPIPSHRADPPGLFPHPPPPADGVPSGVTWAPRAIGAPPPPPPPAPLPGGLACAAAAWGAAPSPPPPEPSPTSRGESGSRCPPSLPPTDFGD